VSLMQSCWPCGLSHCHSRGSMICYVLCCSMPSYVLCAVLCCAVGHLVEGLPFHRFYFDLLISRGDDYKPPNTTISQPHVSTIYGCPTECSPDHTTQVVGWSSCCYSSVSLSRALLTQQLAAYL